MAFDERGHTPNTMNYFVSGYRGNGAAPKRVIATWDEFVGEGGSLAGPHYVYDGGYATAKKAAGKEPFAGLDFGAITLKKGASVTFTIMMGMTTGDPAAIVRKFNTPAKVAKALEGSQKAWLPVFNSYTLNGGNPDFAFWAQWVNMQPTFRKIFGCSFLPHFDYGRGGRGWRDLWQDLLGLLLFDPAQTRQTLINNFKGVRIDGSNATIIRNDGGFLADRNKISRVWMDHGVWPYLTLRLYLDQTGDFDMLFEEFPYFKDNLLNRAKANDPSFPEKDNLLRAKDGQPHSASVFEHTLVQNLVQFYNAGDRGNTKLEDADWNDGLDMAHGKGESVAFTCMYAHNLRDMAQLLRALEEKQHIAEVDLTAEVTMLLDTMGTAINYSSMEERRTLLQKYFDAACRGVAGGKTKVAVEALAADLEKKADYLSGHILKQEWLRNPGIFNGYYDNAGRPVEGMVKGSPRVTLTSGVFALMSGIATDEQVATVHRSFGKYLRIGSSVLTG
jgi:cellobiose phosphorylase